MLSLRPCGATGRWRSCPRTTRAPGLAPLPCAALRRLRAGTRVAGLDGLQGCAQLSERSVCVESQITDIEPLRARTALRRLNLNTESMFAIFADLCPPVEPDDRAVEVLRLRRVRDLRVVGYALDAARLLLPLAGFRAAGAAAL